MKAESENMFLCTPDRGQVESCAGSRTEVTFCMVLELLLGMFPLATMRVTLRMSLEWTQCSVVSYRLRPLDGSLPRAVSGNKPKMMLQYFVCKVSDFVPSVACSIIICFCVLKVSFFLAG